MRSRVVSVEPKSPGWTDVLLEDGTDLQVYVNWFTQFGELKPGDEVEYDVMGPGTPMKRNFRRAPKESMVE